MSDGGKGSSPRPYSVSGKEYDDRWEKIFGEKEGKRLPGHRQSDSLRIAPYVVAVIVLSWVVGIYFLLP